MINLQATQPTGPDIPSLPADRIRKFMATYARTGDVRAAARSGRISISTHYRMLREVESYRAAFEVARAQAIDELEAEAFRRALAGSDELLAFLLRAWLPELYGERIMHELSGSVTVNDVDASDARGTVRRLVAIDRERVQ
jgi:hypothetical protein